MEGGKDGGPPRSRDIQDDIQNGLNKIRQLGPQKPMGYLPTDSLTSYFKSTIDEEVRLAQQNGYIPLLLGPDECEIGLKGALFVYDPTSLSELLNGHSGVLGNNKWPTDPEEFVRRVAKESVPETSDVYRIIAEAFGDKAEMER